MHGASVQVVAESETSQFTYSVQPKPHPDFLLSPLRDAVCQGWPTGTDEAGLFSREGGQQMRVNVIPYTYDRLRGRIIEKYGTFSKFAEAIGSTKATVSNKLVNKVGFDQLDIDRWAKALNIKPKEYGMFFFTPEDNKILS